MRFAYSNGRNRSMMGASTQCKTQTPTIPESQMCCFGSELLRERWGFLHNICQRMNQTAGGTESFLQHGGGLKNSGSFYN